VFIFIIRIIRILKNAEIGTINVDGDINCEQGCLFISMEDRNFSKYILCIGNFISKTMGKHPIWLFPPFLGKIGDFEVKMKGEEFGMTIRAYLLFKEVKKVMKKCPIDPNQKAPLENQTRAVFKNMQNAIWKLYRIRRIKGLIKDRRNDIFNEAQELEDRLRLTMDSTLNALAAVPILIMKVELEDRKTKINQILFDLKNRNQELRTLAFSKRNDLF